MASVRERHLERIVAVLRAAARQGVHVDEEDFEHVKRDAIEDADSEGRRALSTITWDEVNGLLARPSKDPPFG